MWVLASCTYTLSDHTCSNMWDVLSILEANCAVHVYACCNHTSFPETCTCRCMIIRCLSTSPGMTRNVYANITGCLVTTTTASWNHIQGTYHLLYTYSACIHSTVFTDACTLYMYMWYVLSVDSLFSAECTCSSCVCDNFCKSPIPLLKVARLTFEALAFKFLYTLPYDILQTEGSRGYGYWVCHTLTTLAQELILEPGAEGLNLVAVRGMLQARDCLQKYVEREPEDSWALNLLGLLYEQEGLLTQAERAFYRWKLFWKAPEMHVHVGVPLTWHL